jgi:hypothetical protein
MTIPSYLTNTGLPHSVCAVLHVLSRANQLKALALVQEYKACINTISLDEIEQVVRERNAKQALMRRYAQEAKPPKPEKRLQNLAELLA